ncbi:hypothetical protein [Streptomyces sp. NPDC096012]|uniref:hypothetical protein n=1 Tax=Streptomyces sp. NPDC096012 TaxID=3155684 RepID=UPI003369CEA8
MHTTRHLNLVVLHDLDDALAAVKEALAHADAAEAPGLRKALTVIEAAARSDEDLKIRWARETLGRAGLTAGDKSVRAIRELRRTAPQLGLAEAVELVTLAAKH